jgi:hypothetical protein
LYVFGFFPLSFLALPCQCFPFGSSAQYFTFWLFPCQFLPFDLPCQGQMDNARQIPRHLRHATTLSFHPVFLPPASSIQLLTSTARPAQRNRAVGSKEVEH